jgi:hypothetical protein
MEKTKTTKDLKWTKTDVVRIASCMKEQSPSEQDENEESIGGLEINSVCNKATDLEDDDVFIWDQPRRASEPLVLKRNSDALMSRSARLRPSKLRSLSEDVAAVGNRPQGSKQARSISETHATHSLTFSPRIVKKINLSASLKEWLEKEKQTSKQSTVGKNIHFNDECADHLENGGDYHLYRRRSADAVGKALKIDEGRRPSAPPALAGQKNACEAENSVSTKSYTPPCCNNDNKFASVYELQIHTLIKEELKSKLDSVYFCAQSSRQWCEQISEVIKDRVQGLLNIQCKVVCTIYIGALRGHGIHTASQATLDHKLDYHVSAFYQNESLFATVCVLVVRYGNR